MKDNAIARFAVLGDFDFCRKMDFGFIGDEKMEYIIGQEEAIVGTLDGKPVGYLRLEYLWHKMPYIGLILVEEAHRRKGVGKAMLRFAEDYLRAKGHPVLYSSSQEDEPEPQEWHRHVGFADCGIIERINRGGVGEVFFEKRLR